MKKILTFMLAFALAFCSLGSVSSVYAATYYFGEDGEFLERTYRFDKENKIFYIDDYACQLQNEDDPYSVDVIDEWGEVAFTVLRGSYWNNSQMYYEYWLFVYPATHNLAVYSTYNGTFKEWTIRGSAYNYNDDFLDSGVVGMRVSWYSGEDGAPDHVGTCSYDPQESNIYLFDGKSDLDINATIPKLFDYTTRIIYEYDDDNLTPSTTVFMKPLPVTKGTLAPIVAKVKENPLQEVKMILPMMMVCLVGYLALRKALSILVQLLHKA